jgi:hypothetical protein
MRVLSWFVLFAVLVAAPVRAGSLLDLHVVDRDTGQVLTPWSAQGRLYVAGTPGHRYAVRLANRSGARVLAVLSVDGVNAVSGETADTDQAGYVLDPWQTTDITGWRKSLGDVAQFNFTALPDSYAARTGRPGNVGVIGVAVFTERVPAWRKRLQMDTSRIPAPAPPSAMERADSASAGAPPARTKALAQEEDRLGTGHGAREDSPVTMVPFERASRHPAESLAIWYDSLANLVARGIVPAAPLAGIPQPFPGDFVPDPPSR